MAHIQFCHSCFSTHRVEQYAMKLAIILWCITGGFCYMPAGKENFLSGLILQDWMNRLSNSNKDGGDGVSYLDFPDAGGLPLNARSMNRDLEDEQMFPLDYEGLGEMNLHPSIRDQEYLQHSALWGNQYVSGGAGEGQQLLQPDGTIKNQQEVKSDSTLPAYCNPPNPCPVGYSGDQGCLEEFENTASYSRRYQANEDCMCDTEHMFDCPNPQNNMGVDNPMESLDNLEFNRFIQHTMKMNPGFQHKNLVAKKYHLSDKSVHANNPFLTGEKLPVAAKKGKNVIF